MKKYILLIQLMLVTACVSSTSTPYRIDENVIPAEQFSKAVHEGRENNFSIYDSTNESKSRAQLRNAALSSPTGATYLEQGYSLKRTVSAPETIAVSTNNNPTQVNYNPNSAHVNPSLYREASNSYSMFRDFRAFQPMDVISIKIDESSKGTSKGKTEADREFDILAGITSFFGIETSKWAANNTALNPSQLISATSNVEFAGEGETEREGSFKSSISAVIMEVLTNGLMRIEGTKIISINNEEEIMVVSGLIRQRDISATNQVLSSRIANMRVDFYGRGIVADQQKSGWGMKIFQLIWPF